MRVISGSAKGCGLKAPRRMKLRPTPSRVKEAIFSSLAKHIAGARVLELFAGTGAFSIEALSRNAATAILVEKDRRATILIQGNLQKTHLEKHARILQLDVRQALDRLQKEREYFNLIFADPPYQKKYPLPSLNLSTRSSNAHYSAPIFPWVPFLLRSASLCHLLAKDGVLLIEYFKKHTTIDSPYFRLIREFRFGDTVVGVFLHRTQTNFGEDG